MLILKQVRRDSNSGVPRLGSGCWNPGASGWRTRRVRLQASGRVHRTPQTGDGQKCESVAIIARRRGLFSMSWFIFCLRIRGDHVASPRPSCPSLGGNCLSARALPLTRDCRRDYMLRENQRSGMRSAQLGFCRSSSSDLLKGRQ